MALLIIVLAAGYAAVIAASICYGKKASEFFSDHQGKEPSAVPFYGVLMVGAVAIAAVFMRLGLHPGFLMVLLPGWFVPSFLIHLCTTYYLEGKKREHKDGESRQPKDP